MDIGADYSHLYANNKKNQKRKIGTDGIRVKKRSQTPQSMDGLRLTQNNHHNNTVFSARGGNMDSLCVKNPQRYIITPQQRQEMYRQHYLRSQRSLDGVKIQKRIKNPIKKERRVEEQQQSIIQNTYNAFAAYRNALDFSISPTRMWQLSLTGAMIFGMVSMSLIYRNLGQSAFAKDAADKALAATQQDQIVEMVDEKKEQDVQEKSEKKESTEKKSEKEDMAEKDRIEKNEKEPVIVADIVEKKDLVNQEEGIKDEQKVEKKSVDSASEKTTKEDREKNQEEIESEKTLKEIAYETVEGYPIEKMLPYILDQDPEVAKYLIAIAKQESGWGKRVPVLNGQDCYNYWGYRGTRKLMGSGGHTCFNSRKDAVETVGKRIKELIYDYDRTTASRLIVWKCGSSCDGHSQAGVDRWIGTVDTYYQKLSQK